jgi:hypothetical protein
MATAMAMACLPASAEQTVGSWVRAFYSGNDLWAQCSGNSDYLSGLCRGYVTGIADAMTNVAGIYGRRACIPMPVTVGQTVDVVKQYLGQHPEQRHYTASYLVAQALAEAFPCER